MLFTDLGPVVVQSLETSYIQPLRESAFVRIRFENFDKTSQNPIRVWFQGKR
jgi:hypothetical protein